MTAAIYVLEQELVENHEIGLPEGVSLFWVSSILSSSLRRKSALPAARK